MKEATYRSIWFTEFGSLRPIGIVIVCDPNTKLPDKAYIGTGHGQDQRASVALKLIEEI